MLPIVTFLAFSFQAVEAPRTINSVELGNLADFTIEGPARLCVGDMAVDLESEETAYVQYLGIHNASVIVADPRRSYELNISDNFADPADSAQMVSQTHRALLTQHGNGTRARFLYSSWNVDLNEFSPRIWIDDEQVRRPRIARQIFGKISFVDDQPANCDRIFVYGWEALFGDGVGERRNASGNVDE
ncbi:hypothetical protein [Parasphingopyxis lamellibrachiae]|uniref:Uncharacterized protein n=1 Tax=Parasphingopyxis lamellibrachiae TaxID=680125 RepID=A0A3D9FBH6_9SPHN|nr:hypothetical protein [Parasphingopyxis lamellibrachiae]RED15189.1 hypothetical protein DFR46_0176 [Parasphingopyxis lamellibrachiae]